MTVKEAIKMLQEYNPEEIIFFELYTKADLDFIDMADKVSSDQLEEIFEVMNNWSNTDNFVEAIDHVLAKEVNK